MNGTFSIKSTQHTLLRLKKSHNSKIKNVRLSVHFIEIVASKTHCFHVRHSPNAGSTRGELQKASARNVVV